MADGRRLMSGNHVIAEAAIRAGCRFFAGYPITPQSELVEYMAAEMPLRGGTFVQAESELAAGAMIYGAAAAGCLAMSASSGPGFTLLQEGLTYTAAAELPLVVVDVARRNPGLGTIEPAQSDYLQAVKGGGHGDYRLLVYAPANHEEAARLTFKAFAKAVEYRNPVLILLDGALGQMKEPVRLPAPEYAREVGLAPETLAGFTADGSTARDSRTIGMTSYVKPDYTAGLREKYRRMRSAERAFETFLTDDAEVIIVAYGISARVARESVRAARAMGIRAGLFRPITLWPFPHAELAEAGRAARHLISAEMSLGQLVEDVAASARRPDQRVSLFSEAEGPIPESGALVRFIQETMAGRTEEVRL